MQLPFSSQLVFFVDVVCEGLAVNFFQEQHLVTEALLIVLLLGSNLLDQTMVGLINHISLGGFPDVLNNIVRAKVNVIDDVVKLANLVSLILNGLIKLHSLDLNLFFFS